MTIEVFTLTEPKVMEDWVKLLTGGIELMITTTNKAYC